MRGLIRLGAALLIVAAACTRTAPGRSEQETIRQALERIADGTGDPLPLAVTYDDLHALHGGLRLTIRGTGSVVQEAVRRAAGDPRQASPEDMVRLARLLARHEVWVQRVPERPPVPDESRATLTVSYGGSSVSIWEWHDELDRVARIGEVRALMARIAWSEVVLVAERRAYRVAQDAEGRWAAGEPRPLPDAAISAAADGDDVWVMTGSETVRLDRELAVAARAPIAVEPSPSWDAPPPPYRRKGDLDAARGHAFASVERAFLVLDREGNVRARLPLPKVEHDVLVHEGVAYLIDDVVLPYWVHRIDVRDPAAPRVLDQQAVQLQTGHFETQWLDPASGRWFVTASRQTAWAGLARVYELLIFSLEGGAPQRRTLYAQGPLSRPRKGEAGPPPLWPRASSLWRVTGTPPVWGLLETAGRATVVRLDTGEAPGAIRATLRLPDGLPRDGATGLARRHATLYVAIGRRLRVLDVSGDGAPRELASVPLPETPIEIVVR